MQFCEHRSAIDPDSLTDGIEQSIYKVNYISGGIQKLFPDNTSSVIDFKYFPENENIFVTYENMLVLNNYPVPNSGETLFSSPATEFLSAKTSNDFKKVIYLSGENRNWYFVDLESEVIQPRIFFNSDDYKVGIGQ